MPVRTSWHDERKTIINQVYEGRCVAADFHSSVDDVYRLVSSVTHTVDVIVDMTDAAFVGTSFLSVRGTSEAKVLHNQRMAILVGAPAFIRTLVSIGKKVAPKTTRNIHFVKTIAAAHELIAVSQQTVA